MKLSTRLARQATGTPKRIITEPINLTDNQIFTVPALKTVFGLTAAGVRREIKAGRLAGCKRIGRYYFTGRQLREWFEAGAFKRKSSQERAENYIALHQEI